MEIFFVYFNFEQGGTPWARATKNVKKPHSQMCESCRKAWFKIFVKIKQKHFWFQSQILFWGLLLYKISFNKQTNEINCINDNHIKFDVSLHFWGIWSTVWRPLKTFKYISWRLFELPKKRVYNIVFSFLQRKSGLPRAPNLQKFSIFFTPFLLFTYILAADSYHTLLLEKSERI